MAEKVLFRTSLTDTESTDVEGVGTIRKDDKGRKYKWVRNTNGTTLTAKQAVCYDIANNTGAADMLQEVIDPATANLMAFAGIAMSAATDDSYFWILIRGLIDDAITDVPVSAAIIVGDFLLPTDALEHLGEAGSLVAPGTSPTYPFGAVATEGVLTASTGTVGATQVYVIGMGS